MVACVIHHDTSFEFGELLESSGAVRRSTSVNPDESDCAVAVAVPAPEGLRTFGRHRGRIEQVADCRVCFEAQRNRPYLPASNPRSRIRLR